MSFNYLPYPETLQSLYPRALTSVTELSKAIRMWVILRTIYGNENDSLKLISNKDWTYAEWRDRFFNGAKIHQQEKTIEKIHDSNCPCAKTLHNWLFDGDSGVEQDKWQETLAKTNFSNKLSAKRPFACTRRSVQNSFQELVEKNWLGKNGDRYTKLEQLPNISINNNRKYDAENLKFIGEDIAEITGNYFEPINNISRFFIHVEYIPSVNTIDRVGDYQNILKNIWLQTLIPPVKLNYKSASFHNDRTFDYIVYPVCIYYYRRAPYLCAYGQTPVKKNVLDWYNYRLDKIIELTELTWQDSQIPSELKKCEKSNNPYNPEYIQEQLEEAFGFDFFLDSETMLLRFERDFGDRYIKNTERHPTFTHLSSVENVKKFIEKSHATPPEKAKLIAKIKQCPHDAYYTMDYRKDDKNVIWRLRTWGAKVEVLYPSSLRQTTIDDIQAAYKIYQ